MFNVHGRGEPTNLAEQHHQLRQGGQEEPVRVPHPPQHKQHHRWRGRQDHQAFQAANGLSHSQSQLPAYFFALYFNVHMYVCVNYIFENIL